MQYNLVLGVTLSLLGSLFYAVQVALARGYAHGCPLSMMVFIQACVAFVLFLPLLLKNGVASARRKLHTKKMHLHILRAIASLGINTLIFAAVKYIPLVNAMLLSNTVPLIVPFLAYLYFGHRINHRLWLPIFVGFVGVAIVLKPDSHFFNPADFFALGAAACMSTTMLLVRHLSATDTFEATSFYVFVYSMLISGVVALFNWQSLSGQLWFILFLIGVMYFLVQYFMTIALKYANPQLVSSLLYTSIIFSVFIAWGVWGTLPDASMLLGMLCIVVGGILCIRADYRHSKRI